MFKIGDKVRLCNEKEFNQLMIKYNYEFTYGFNQSMRIHFGQIIVINELLGNDGFRVERWSWDGRFAFKLPIRKLRRKRV